MPKRELVAYEKPRLPIATMNWELRGVIQERRELKTKDGSRVWAWTFKLAAVGSSYDVRVTEKGFKQIAEGMNVRVTGKVEFFNNNAQFVSTTIAEVEVNDEGLALGEYPLDIAEPK